MKQLVIISILMIMYMMQGYSQTDTTKGINFLEHSTWQQVQQTARAEHKYIFVDCYASWCGPCKMMDRDVYTNDTVAKFMSEHFISVKLQMDSTGHDSQEIQNWRSVSHDFENRFKIKAYPSFLFFSPDGQICHRDLGARDAASFVNLASTAMDPKQQIYTLISCYQNGERDYTTLPKLIDKLKSMGEDSLWIPMAKDYIHSYLQKLPEDKLWAKQNLRLLRSYRSMLHVTDTLFQLYFKDRVEIDSIMNEKKYANWLINEVIYTDYVHVGIKLAEKNNQVPDWKKITKSIKDIYGNDFAETNVLDGQVAYYHTRKDWKRYISYYVRQIEINGLPTPNSHLPALLAAEYLNNDAWEVFKYSSNKDQLKKALTWIDFALSLTSPPFPNALDTKANLLYKLGRKDEAMVLEKQSVGLLADDKTVQENFEKMKEGHPTWPTVIAGQSVK